MQYRIKTEQEFIDEFGENWKANDIDWVSDMDYLFGCLVDSNKKFYTDGFTIDESMITDLPLPKEEENKIKGSDMDIYKYGDRILVWNNNGEEEEAEERIFIAFGQRGKTMCVDEQEEYYFRNGHSFNVDPWDNHLPLKVENKYKPEEMIGKIIRHKSRQNYYTIIKADMRSFSTDNDIVSWADFDEYFELVN